MSTEIIPPHIAAFSGPLLLGHLFNWGLFGALTVQVYLYYLSFPHDRFGSKLLVLSIYTLEVAQTMLATHDAFGALGSGWGHPEALRDPQWLWLSVPIFSGIISCTVQTFFAWRIYVLSKSPYLGIFIVLLAFMEGIAGIVQGVEAFQIGDLSILQDHAFKSAAVWLGGSALCDVIIACTMTFYLWRSNTGFRQTSVLLSRLIRLTIETGMITATVASVDLLLFLVFRENNFHITPSLTLAKFYSNNLLVIFNSRIRIVGARDQMAPAFEGGGYGGYSGDTSGNGAVTGVTSAGPTPNSYNFRDGTSTVLSTVSASKGNGRGFKTTFAGGAKSGKAGYGIGHGPNEFPLSGITVDVTTQRDTDEESLPTQGEGGNAKFDNEHWDSKPAPV